MTDDLDRMPLRELARRLRGRETTAAELAERSAERHRQRGAHDNAYITWTGDHARSFAEATDMLIRAGGDAGPLMGLPISIKDLFGVPGLPTYAGSARRLPPKWEQPGPVVRATLRQLPVLMGKTHTVEFAFGGVGTNIHHGTPRNPWDPAFHRVPGGSSSGAGVSIATGTSHLALGSDTAGSVRIPASMNGVAGLKITAGRWSTQGIVPLSTTLDTPGLLAATVDDLAYAFAALDGDLTRRASEEFPVPDLSHLTFGLPSRYFWDDCSTGIAETVEAACRELECAGARLVPLDLAGCDESYHLLQQGGVAAIEIAAFLNAELSDAIPALDPAVAARIAAADALPAWEYVRRRALLDRLTADAAEDLRGVDALVAPTVAVTPPRLDELRPEGAYARANMLALRNTVIANFMGLCAVTLPAGRDVAGMPVGLQLMARGGTDFRLLAVARAVEGCLGPAYKRLGLLPNPHR